MDTTIKQDKSKSSEIFEKLLSEDLDKRKFTEGELISGTVESIGTKFVFLDLGLKSSGAIPLSEFKLTKSLDALTVGSKIDVLLEKLENRDGDVVVSFEKGKRRKSWSRMERCFESGKTVTGTILSKCRGGMVVDADSCLMFLPGSQVSLRPLKDFSALMKVPLEFEIVKMDKKRGNIVCSRRAVLEKIRDHDRDKIISKIKEGDIISGTVKNLTEWGAFIDLAGVDSLLHITDISWSRINKPSELLSIGQSLKVKIIKIDSKTKKISVGVKQLTEDPYTKAIKNFDIGKTYSAVVTKVQDYGCFAQLADGLEGLIHQSELSWTKKNIHPGKVLSTSQKIEVQILEKDLEKRRISLSYKNTLVNPWIKFDKEHKIGNEFEGVVKNITDYALFVTIKDSDLDGMIHYKDLSWSEKDTELKKWKKNDKIKFKILEINQEKEKIRLGIKQLTTDPWKVYENKKVSDVVTAIVESTSKNGIYVYVGNRDFPILIKKNNLANEIGNARQSRFVPGQKVDALITELNKNERKISLSIKALEEQQTKETVKKYGSKDSGALLGEILGPLLKKNKEKSKK